MNAARPPERARSVAEGDAGGMAASRRLCLLSWNVQWFCGLDQRVDVARVLAHARALADFDLLCLQEVAIGYPGLAGGAGFD